MKILIFGTGSVARILLGKIRKDVHIVAFINSDEHITEFYGYKVITPERVIEYQYDFIVIASGYVQEIKSKLKTLKIPEDKIIAFIFDNADTYQEISQNIKEYLDIKMNRSKMRSILQDLSLLPQINAAVYWKNDAFQTIYKDYVREQTLYLISKEIHRKGLSGSVAELGVYKGDFTIMIRKALPEYPIYLFDTFHGFSDENIASDDTIDNKKNELLKFKDTSAEYVLSRLSDGTGEIIVKEGLFPDTFDLWEKKFVFVSIDLNLMEPVKKGLELFYPRLKKGGYIIISDYNAPFYEGTRIAVMDYCDQRGISYIPIPDLYGTIIITR